LRSQRVNERLPDPADAWWLAGTASEHRLDVWARLRERNRDGRAQ
jgi:hypothetical protein